MTGGSSGGPVVLNVREDYTGMSSYTQDNYANRLNSVVSWDYISQGPQVQGGARFDSNLGAMLSATCSANSWAC